MRDLRVKTGSLELQIREYEREAAAVVFLHFGGGNLMMWQRAIPYFQEQYRLILVDLRDHGHSDKPQSGNDIDQMARDVAGMLDALEIEKAHVVGSSLGAEVGLSLAANFPAKVNSLVCDGANSSEFGPYSAWTDSEAAFQQHVENLLSGMRERPVKIFPSVSEFVAERREALEKHGLWNEHMAALQEYDAFEARPGEFTRSWQKQASLNYMTHYFACRFEDYYRRVTCPVLLAASDETEPDELRAMQGLCQLAARGQTALVPGWEHPYGWLTAPDAMCKVILAFLAETA
jgi:2-succinyl-6-hydroxy-2,4-cyclohexadiene-1-carboxylate synthase